MRKRTSRVSTGGTSATAVAEAPEQDSRFDRRMAELLSHATDVFYERGYEGASMRDLSRASGMSLAGLYHYVDSKERLLFLIQRHTFSTILVSLREKLSASADPVDRLRIFINNHLEYFLANMKAMKVLSHEDDVLTGEYAEQVQAIKREYFKTCLELVSAVRRSGVQFQPQPGRGGQPNNDDRIAVLILFGMMNWLYTWFNPRIDREGRELAAQMTDMFLYGLLGNPKTSSVRKPRS